MAYQRVLKSCQRVLKACHRGLRACQRGLRACQMGLGACQRGLRACQRGLRASHRSLRACQRGLRACQEAQGRDGRTDERTNRRTEFLPILQDFVPCRGRCPKSVNSIYTLRERYEYTFILLQVRQWLTVLASRCLAAGCWGSRMDGCLADFFSYR